MKRYNLSKLASVTAGLAVGVLILGACSFGGGSTPGPGEASSTTTNDPGIALAKAAVTAATAPITSFQAPGPAFDAAKASGKDVWVLAPLSVPFAATALRGMREAASTAHVTITAFDTKAQVALTSQGIQQAIAAHAAAILIIALPVTLFSADLATAQKAGIKVISVENHDPGLPPSTDPKAVVASVDQCHGCAGTVMADYVIAKAKGAANVVIFWSSDSPGIGEPQLKAIKEEFATNCASCKVSVEDAPIATWATRLTAQTQSVLTANPKANVLLPIYDGMVPFMLPAVYAANRSSGVSIVTYNATPAVMQSLAKGDVVVADIGVGTTRFGWAWADQAFRVLAGAAPVADENVPLRLFDSTNVKQLKIDGPDDAWYGTVDYRSAYEKLWGLS
ncbi:sugar ABC transporter substrate-binding protein [bacterium]|nr:MAG: sugar ABC transporter substrate-binding protein [bacterium]